MSNGRGLPETSEESVLFCSRFIWERSFRLNVQIFTIYLYDSSQTCLLLQSLKTIVAQAIRVQNDMFSKRQSLLRDPWEQQLLCFLGKSDDITVSPVNHSHTRRSTSLGMRKKANGSVWCLRCPALWCSMSSRFTCLKRSTWNLLSVIFCMKLPTSWVEIGQGPNWEKTGSWLHSHTLRPFRWNVFQKKKNLKQSMRHSVGEQGTEDQTKPNTSRTCFSPKWARF